MMLIEAKFPVVLTDVELHRHSRRHDVFYMADTVLDIREIEHREIEYALEVTQKEYGRNRWRPVVSIAYDNGRFFQNSGVHVSDFRSRCADPVETLRQFRTFAFDQLSAAPATPGLQLLPKTVPHLIIGNAIAADFDGIRRFNDRYAPKIQITARDQATILEAEMRFLNCADSLFICDGYVWQEVPEPYLTVDVKLCPGRLGCSTQRLPFRSPITIEERPSNSAVLFAVGQHDEALSLAQSLYDSSSPWPVKDFKADILIPEVFGVEMPIGDAVGQLANYRASMGIWEDNHHPLNAFLADDREWTVDGLLEQFTREINKHGDFIKTHFPCMTIEAERLSELEMSVSLGSIKSAFGSL